MKPGNYNVTVHVTQAEELVSPESTGWIKSDALNVVCKVTMLGQSKKTKKVKTGFWNEQLFFPLQNVNRA